MFGIEQTQAGQSEAAETWLVTWELSVVFVTSPKTGFRTSELLHFWEFWEDRDTQSCQKNIVLVKLSVMRIYKGCGTIKKEKTGHMKPPLSANCHHIIREIPANIQRLGLNNNKK